MDTRHFYPSSIYVWSFWVFSAKLPNSSVAECARTDAGDPDLHSAPGMNLWGEQLCVNIGGNTRTTIAAEDSASRWTHSLSFWSRGMMLAKPVVSSDNQACQLQTTGHHEPSLVSRTRSRETCFPGRVLEVITRNPVARCMLTTESWAGT